MLILSKSVANLLLLFSDPHPPPVRNGGLQRVQRAIRENGESGAYVMLSHGLLGMSHRVSATRAAWTVSPVSGSYHQVIFTNCKIYDVHIILFSVTPILGVGEDAPQSSDLPWWFPPPPTDTLRQPDLWPHWSALNLDRNRHDDDYPVGENIAPVSLDDIEDIELGNYWVAPEPAPTSAGPSTAAAPDESGPSTNVEGSGPDVPEGEVSATTPGPGSEAAEVPSDAAELQDLPPTAVEEPTQPLAPVTVDAAEGPVDTTEAVDNRRRSERSRTAPGIFVDFGENYF